MINSGGPASCGRQTARPYFGTSPDFWLNLQKTWELRTAELKKGAEITRRVRPRAA